MLEPNENDPTPPARQAVETSPAARPGECDDPPQTGPFSFSEVLDEELKEIDASRKAREVETTGESSKGITGAHSRNLIGLAFSGGGIRSATFNLGVLQSLARFQPEAGASAGRGKAGGGPEESSPERSNQENRPKSCSLLRQVYSLLRTLQDFAKLPPKAGASSGSEGAEGSTKQSPKPCCLLRQVDSLSTVSGGGYIGSWLVTLLYRLGKSAGDGAVFEELRKQIVRGAGPEPEKEGEPVNFLRDYSNYLTPRKGILGADTWAAIAIYLRNTLLNSIILFLAVSALLLLPRAVAAVAKACSGDLTEQGATLAISAVAAVMASLVLIARNMLLLGGEELPEGGEKPPESPPWYSKEKWILVFIVGPLLSGAVLGTLWLWHHKDNWWANYCIAAAWGAGLYLVLSLPGTLATKPQSGKTQGEIRQPWDVRYSRPVSIFTSIFAGAVGGLLLLSFEKLLCYWCGATAGLYHFTVAGPPLLALGFLSVGALHLGLIGRSYSDHQREWWGRLGGWMLIFSLSWAALGSLAFYGPLGALLLQGWVKTKFGAFLAWLGTSAGGALAGSSSQSSGKEGGKSWIERYASVAPFVFVLGLLLLLSCGIHATLNHFTQAATGKPCARNALPCNKPAETEKREGAPSGSLTIVQPLVAETADQGNPPVAAGKKSVQVNLQLQYQEAAIDREELYRKYWGQLAAQDGNLFSILLGMGVLLFLAATLSWRVDINEFSMQMLYRNRLVRCYLGATWAQERRPAPFTGFDPHDDILLRKLRAPSPRKGTKVPEEDRSKPKQGDQDYVGPLPILNTALNYTHGRRLAWQERKAESFIFTPLCSGYEFQEQTKEGTEEEKTAPPTAYRCTSRYAYPGGVYIGTAMGISGAAASPNMGYHTSPAVAFLMTVFNVRLGWWMGNPRKDYWQHAGPWLGLPYLFFELFATTNDTSRYVYLSDGGHFENLGIYELVRRRCKLIIACDADADENYTFEDLGNAIRKCRSDFGVPIDINTDSIRPLEDEERGTKLSKRHYAMGTIKYSAVDRDTKGQPVKDDGLLVYLKTSLTGDEPGDVRAYKALHSDFPQQSTADQWFDESQFESYRALGEHVMDSFLDDLNLG